MFFSGRSSSSLILQYSDDISWKEIPLLEDHKSCQNKNMDVQFCHGGLFPPWTMSGSKCSAVYDNFPISQWHKVASTQNTQYWLCDLNFDPTLPKTGAILNRYLTTSFLTLHSYIFPLVYINLITYSLSLFRMVRKKDHLVLCCPSAISNLYPNSILVAKTGKKQQLAVVVVYLYTISRSSDSRKYLLHVYIYSFIWRKDLCRVNTMALTASVKSFLSFTCQGPNQNA